MFDFPHEGVAGFEGQPSLGAKQMEQPGPEQNARLAGMLGMQTRPSRLQPLLVQPGLRREGQVQILTFQTVADLVEWLEHPGDSRSAPTMCGRSMVATS